MFPSDVQYSLSYSAKALAKEGSQSVHGISLKLNPTITKILRKQPPPAVSIEFSNDEEGYLYVDDEKFKLKSAPLAEGSVFEAFQLGSSVSSESENATNVALDYITTMATRFIAEADLRSTSRRVSEGVRIEQQSRKKTQLLVGIRPETESCDGINKRPAKKSKSSVSDTIPTTTTVGSSSSRNTRQKQTQPLAFIATNNWVRLPALPVLITEDDVRRFFSGLGISRIFATLIGQDNSRTEVDRNSLVDIFVEFADLATATAAVRRDGEELIFDNNSKQIVVDLRPLTKDEIMWVCAIGLHWDNSLQQNLASIHAVLELQPFLVDVIEVFCPVHLAHSGLWQCVRAEFISDSDSNIDSSQKPQLSLSLATKLGLSTVFPLTGSPLMTRSNDVFVMEQLIQSRERDFSARNVIPTFEAADLVTMSGNSCQSNSQPARIAFLKLSGCSKLEKLRGQQKSFEWKTKDEDERMAQLITNAMLLEKLSPLNGSSSVMVLSESIGEKQQCNDWDASVRKLLAFLHCRLQSLQAQLSFGMSNPLTRLLSSVSNSVPTLSFTAQLRHNPLTVQTMICLLSRMKLLLSVIHFILWQQLLRT